MKTNNKLFYNKIFDAFKLKVYCTKNSLFIDLNIMKYVYYSTINITTLLFNIFYINVYVFLSNKVEKIEKKNCLYIIIIVPSNRIEVREQQSNI